MVIARSRLFFFNLTSAWAWTIFTSLFLIVRRPNDVVTERWRDNPALVSSLTAVFAILMIISAIVLCVSLAIEVAVRRGWEPHFLEVYKPGCTILNKERIEGGRAMVTVRDGNGNVATYEADPSEVPDVHVGSISHLHVIGPFISQIRIIQDNAAILSMNSFERESISKSRHPIASALILIVSVAVTGYMVAYGSVMISSGSLVVPFFGETDTGRPDADLYEDTWVNVFGLFLVLFGAGGFAFLWHRWKTGWNDESLENLSEREGPDWS